MTVYLEGEIGFACMNPTCPCRSKAEGITWRSDLDIGVESTVEVFLLNKRQCPFCHSRPILYFLRLTAKRFIEDFPIGEVEMFLPE